MVETQMLHGVRVLDFGRFVSGSYASMLLAALGVDVIKVEALPDGDPYRNQGTAKVGPSSALFLALNNGKRSIAVDLHHPEGVEVVDQLLGGCDLFIENARPGSLARYGLDYAAVHARHPRLIYGSISGYGQTGPMAARGGFDLILQAEAGIMSVTGSSASGPVKVGAPLLDIAAGTALVCGMLGALIQRSRTGMGCHVSSSLFEVALAGLSTVAADYFVTGTPPARLGADSPTFAPYGSFRARDGHLVLAGSGAEHLWHRLCDALDLPELRVDPRFVTNADRVRNRDALTQHLERRLASRDAAEWVELLTDAGVPAGVVRDVGAVLASAQTAALGMVQTLQTPEAQPYRSVTVPIRSSVGPTDARGAPGLGQHTHEVLRQAGWTDHAIADLVARGVVGGAWAT